MKQHLIIFSVASLLLFACSKKDTTTPVTNNLTNNTTTTKINSYGLFIGGETIADSGSTPTKGVTFSASFYKYVNSDTALLDAGVVTGGGYTLSQIYGPNWPYLYQDSVPWKGANTLWSISGSSAVPADSFLCSKSLPIAPIITSSTIVNGANGYTMSWTPTNADSVTIAVYNATLNKIFPPKTLKGSATSYSFPKSNLYLIFACPIIQNYLSITAFNTEVIEIGNKKYIAKSVRVYNKYNITIQ